MKGAYGQAPHDRYLLHYQPSMELAQPWKEFIADSACILRHEPASRIVIFGDKRF